MAKSIILKCGNISGAMEQNTKHAQKFCVLAPFLVAHVFDISAAVSSSGSGNAVENRSREGKRGDTTGLAF